VRVVAPLVGKLKSSGVLCARGKHQSIAATRYFNCLLQSASGGHPDFFSRRRSGRHCSVKTRLGERGWPVIRSKPGNVSGTAIEIIRPHARLSRHWNKKETERN